MKIVFDGSVNMKTQEIVRKEEVVKTITLLKHVKCTASMGLAHLCRAVN